jgi:hypothetical protein
MTTGYSLQFSHHPSSPGSKYEYKKLSLGTGPECVELGNGKDDCSLYLRAEGVDSGHLPKSKEGDFSWRSDSRFMGHTKPLS